MGPLATVDFLRKLVELTPASCDQDHLPVIVHSVPQIPDRSQCIEGRGDSPLPAMLNGLSILEAAGADIVAMPCNTAHYWHADLQRQSKVNVLHIADAAITALDREAPRNCLVGLLATTGTILADIYGSRLETAGHRLLLPNARRQEELVMAGIRSVKAGLPAQGKEFLQAAIADLTAAGARAVILGCTEIPLALEGIEWPHDLPLIDATESLAMACIACSRVAALAQTV